MMRILGKWIKDKGHYNRPSGDFHETPLGWSDSKRGIPLGESMMIHLEDRLSERIRERYGCSVQVIGDAQRKIPIALSHAVGDIPQYEIDVLAKYAKNAMRVDKVIEIPELFDSPFYIESDDPHHEKNRKCKGGGQSHYDRVKDFCCRLNERAFMVRLGSDEYTGEQVESIIMRAMEYQAKLFGCGYGGDEAMERIQSYIDAMCFYFAGGKKGSSLPSCSEEEFIDKIRKGVADRLLSDSDDPWKGFNRTEIKLLSTWVRDRKSLSGFVRLLKSYEGEKGSTIIQKYIGAYYKPYAFIESVLESLK